MLKPGVVLCDSHPIIQDGVARMLGQEFDLLGVADDGRSALGVAGDLSPSVVILEIALPGLNGFEVSRELQKLESRPKIVFFTSCTSPAYLHAAFRSGASAYVAKNSPVPHLATALRAVGRGHQYVSLPGHESGVIVRHADGDTHFPFGELTSRQCQVLQLVGEGMSAKAIAAELNVVQKTVEFHKTAIMTTLKLNSSAALVRFAVESGLVGALSDPNVRAIADLQTLRRVRGESHQSAAANGVHIAAANRGFIDSSPV